MLRGGEVVIQKKRISFGCHHFLLSVLQTSISEGNLSKERTTRSQRNGGTRFSRGQREPHETSRFNTTESSIRSSERVKSQDEGTSELGYGSAARIPNQFLSQGTEQDTEGEGPTPRPTGDRLDCGGPLRPIDGPQLQRYLFYTAVGIRTHDSLGS